MTCERPTPGGGGGATFLKTHSHVAKCYHSSVSFSFFYTTTTTKQECDYKHESFGGGAPIALYHLCNLYTSSKKTRLSTREISEIELDVVIVCTHIPDTLEAATFDRVASALQNSLQHKTAKC